MATPENPQKRPKIVQKGVHSYQRVGPDRVVRTNIRTGERTLFVAKNGTLVQEETWVAPDEVFKERAQSLETFENLERTLRKRPHT